MVFTHSVPLSIRPSVDKVMVIIQTVLTMWSLDGELIRTEHPGSDLRSVDISSIDIAWPMWDKDKWGGGCSALSSASLLSWAMSVKDLAVVSVGVIFEPRIVVGFLVLTDRFDTRVVPVR